MLNANPMKLHYNATGPDRKELVAVISKTIGMKPVYKGMPTCAYAVNNILVEKDGTVVYDERTDQDTIEAIIIALAAAGLPSGTPGSRTCLMCIWCSGWPLIETTSSS